VLLTSNPLLTFARFGRRDFGALTADDPHARRA